MVSLLELQTRFAAALASGDGRPLDGLVATRGLSTTERIGVYRNNHVSTLLRTLELTYPVLRAQLGADDFHTLAVAYVGDVPSASGNLNDYGHRLAEVLGRHALVAGREYLCDVARLEWARQEVYLAAEAPPLDLAVLAEVAPQDYGALCFEVNPAARLIACDCHVTPLFAASQQRDGDFVPQRKPLGVLVLRRSEDIELGSLAPAELRFLTALSAGRCLVAALDAAADDEFDLGAALNRHVALGTLVAVRHGGAPPAPAD